MDLSLNVKIECGNALEIVGLNPKTILTNRLVGT